MKNFFIVISIMLFHAVACSKRPAVNQSQSQDMKKASDSVIVNVPEFAELTDTLKELEDSTDFEKLKVQGNYIYISKSKMRLYVVSRTDSLLFTCGIACGINKGDKLASGDYRTPEGKFSICGIFDSTDWIHKTRYGRRVKGCYGPVFLSLYNGRVSGIGIHGTNAPSSIGKRASEGCIRVKTSNIITIKEHYAYIGMPVYISGEKERLPYFEGTDVDFQDVRKLIDKQYETVKDCADSINNNYIHRELYDSMAIDTVMINTVP